MNGKASGNTEMSSRFLASSCSGVVERAPDVRANTTTSAIRNSCSARDPERAQRDFFDPLFAGLTQGASARYKKKMAAKAAAVALVICVLFALAGARFLDGDGHQLERFRIAGGTLLTRSRFLDMVFARTSGTRSTTTGAGGGARKREDISVFPLAFPFIAGPGALATILLSAGETEARRRCCSAGFLARGARWCCSSAGCSCSGRRDLMRALGVTGAAVVSRLSGVIPAALAVQFIVDGIHGSFPALIKPDSEAVCCDATLEICRRRVSCKPTHTPWPKALAAAEARRRTKIRRATNVSSMLSERSAGSALQTDEHLLGVVLPIRGESQDALGRGPGSAAASAANGRARSAGACGWRFLCHDRERRSGSHRTRQSGDEARRTPRRHRGGSPGGWRSRGALGVQQQPPHAGTGAPRCPGNRSARGILGERGRRPRPCRTRSPDSAVRGGRTAASRSSGASPSSAVAGPEGPEARAPAPGVVRALRAGRSS